MCRSRHGGPGKQTRGSRSEGPFRRTTASTPPEVHRFEPNQVLATLVRNRVDFVIIGGAAANLQGAVQTTDDIDIIYRFEPTNLARLADALAELRAESLTFPGLSTDDWPALLGGSDLWRWRTAFGVLDTMTWASGAPREFDDLKNRSDIAKIDGNAVAVASLDDLIAMKRTTDRPQDTLKLIELEDLRRLRREFDEA